MLQILSPYNQTLIREIPFNNKQDVHRCLDTASALFNDKQKWLVAHERVRVLENLVGLLQEHRTQFIDIAIPEGGKPYRDTVVEMDRAVQGVKLAIQGINSLHGTEIPMGVTASSVNRKAFTTKEPIGVVVVVSAFNHPINLIIHQAITAFASGCPVIIKPALTTPLCALKIQELIIQAGAPASWFQVLVCSNELAEELATDSRVNYLSFIGSSKVGWGLRSKLSVGTRCMLEHGGAAPVIVEDDADLTEVIPSLLKGAFYHAGQVCVSVQRIYTSSGLAIKLANELADQASKLVVGDPMSKNTEVGPLINPKEVDRVAQWVDEAVQSGAQLVCGGKKLSAYCYEPTVLLNPPLDCKVSVNEVFGPVVCIYSSANTEESIHMANALPMSFQAAVFTGSLDKAFSAVQKLNAATVLINDHTAFRVDWMPFGGHDSSGLGVGGIQQSMNDMTRDKLVVIKSKSL